MMCRFRHAFLALGVGQDGAARGDAEHQEEGARAREAGGRLQSGQESRAAHLLEHARQRTVSCNDDVHLQTRAFTPRGYL